jgi:hypothetical protein
MTTVALSKIDNGVAKGYSYGYDQLNRLVFMNQHTTTANPNNWNNTNIIAAYAESIAYDANGNILQYQRKGANNAAGPLDMDSLNYKYNRDVNGNIVNNRLNHVRDAVSNSNYTVDIDNQSSNNYTYDNIGNLKTDAAETISNINWTVYGKIKSVSKTGTTITYGYDPGGNRTYKNVVPSIADDIKSTWYIRDAQGNTLAVYSKTGDGAIKWNEQHLYGSSRLGMWNWDTIVPATPPVVGSNGTPIYDSLLCGSRTYELSNHLGNVLATISDKKIGIPLCPRNQPCIVDYYEAEVLSQNDYYPFGMLQPGRSYTAGSGYRYSINGQEKTPEIASNTTTAEFWQYDARIGRRWNVDPVLKEYESPYAAFGNNPIWFADPDGSDTSKYLSSKQTVDAIKIAYEVIKKRLNEKKYSVGGDYNAELNAGVADYYKNNQNLSFGAIAEFSGQVIAYEKGLREVVNAANGGNIFKEYGTKILYNKSVDNQQTVISTQNLINEKNGQLLGVMVAGVQALAIAAGSVGIKAGPGPRGVFSSGTQQAIVESQAGFKFTNTTIKRFVDPSRTVAATDLRSAVSGKAYADPQGASGASAYYSTILRNGKSYNLKVIYNEESNTVFHFHYSRQAMGPLPKIPK